MGTTTDRDDPGLKALRDDGQQEKHVVLSEEERAKGFVRPVRASYIHAECGTITSMPRAIAETYARRPSFYGATFCASCKVYAAVGTEGEFIWNDGSGEKVGT